MAPLSRDPFRLVMFAFLLETTTKISAYFPFIWAFRPALVLFSLCLLFALVNPARSIDISNFRFSQPKIVLLQLGLACGSALFGISLGHAATFILNQYWKTLIFALLLMCSIRGASDVRRLVWVTALGGMILAFISIFVVGISKDSGAASYDANDVGMLMVTTLPLALLTFQTGGKLGKLASLVGLGLIAVTITKTASRGAFLGASAVGIALLVFLPGVSVIKRSVSVAVIVVAMWMFAPSDYWDTMRTFVSDPTADYNWTAIGGRKQLAEQGMRWMFQYPVFGIGISNFDMAVGTISAQAKAAENTRIGVKWSAAHNSWVQAGAETGIPGLLAWAALIIGSAATLTLLRRRMPRSWGKDGTPEERFLYLATSYVPIALLGFLVSGTFVSFAWSDYSYILPAIAVGIQKSFEVTRRSPAQTVAAGPTIQRSLGRGGLRLRGVPGTSV